MKSRLKWAGGCLAVVIIATAISANSNSGNVSATTPSTVSTTAKPASSASHASAAATVTYYCTGSAPNGVDINYGPEGSSYSASSLPFSKTMPLPANAQYMNTSAQLQGSGNVTCTTSVSMDGQLIRQTGTATGGYNLASAELCSTYDGFWDAC